MNSHLMHVRWSSSFGSVCPCSSHDNDCAKLNSKMTVVMVRTANLICLLYPSNAHVVSLENKGKEIRTNLRFTRATVYKVNPNYILKNKIILVLVKKLTQIWNKTQFMVYSKSKNHQHNSVTWKCKCLYFQVSTRSHLPRCMYVVCLRI